MALVLVKDLMSAPAISFFAEQTLPLAEEIMRLKHLRHLPVIDDQRRLVGLVSHRDLLAAQISNQTGMTREARNAVQAHVRVGQVMTRDVWTVGPDVAASIAAATLLDHKFGCLPVVDAEGILLGIITEHDLLRLVVRVLERPA
jgi:CBS domain-containing membrane protein